MNTLKTHAKESVYAKSEKSLVMLYALALCPLVYNKKVAPMRAATPKSVEDIVVREADPVKSFEEVVLGVADVD